MLAIATPLGLMIRPADQIIRELPPSLSAYWLRFSSAPPRLRCLLTCGVRSPKEKTLQITLWSWLLARATTKRMTLIKSSFVV